MLPPATSAESVSLTVTLSGRPYPLRVLPEDEGPITQIAKELNDKLGDFLLAYEGKDRQDCLAMLLLIYAVDLYKVKAGLRDGARSDTDAQPADAVQAAGDARVNGAPVDSNLPSGGASPRFVEALRQLEAQLADAVGELDAPSVSPTASPPQG